MLQRFYRRLSQQISKFPYPSIDPMNAIIFIVSFIYVGIVIFYAGTFFEDRKRYGILFLSLSLVLSALFSIKGKNIPLMKGRWNTLAVGLISFLAIIAGIYFYKDYNLLLYERISANTGPDFIMAAVVLLLVLIMTLKDMGFILPVLATLFVLYAYFGWIFPGYLHHFGLSTTRMLQTMVLEMEGVYGFLNQLGATWIAIFVMYAGFIMGFGGFDLMMGLGRVIIRKSKTALPQVSVVTSMLFGSFSGSAAANVAGTGSFTIPLMKKSNIPAHYAAAIESMASSGGQIMPPIMGAVAFIMCNYLNVSYLHVVAAGFPPALIFYGCAAMGVYLLTRHIDLTPPEEEILAVPEAGMKGRSYFIEKLIAPLTSIGVLFLLLGYYQLGVLISGFYAIISLLAIKLLSSLIFYRGRGIIDYVKGLATGIGFGARSMVPIAIILACVGIMVRVLTITGLAQKLSFSMVDIAGGNLIVLLLLIGLVSIIFGMAVSTTAAYILVVILGAPALKALGVELIVAHFMVFYLAILAAITPPVAGAVLVACGLAQSPYMKTTFTTVKISLPIFILPFVFITYPQLVMGQANSWLVALVVFTGLSGITYGVNSQAVGLLNIIKRILCVIAGVIILLDFSHSLTWISLAIIVLAIASGPILRRRGALLEPLKQ